MALLLRRVLHRFEVDPSDVRFVATSATIGSADMGDDLRRFLADLSGAPADRVHVVTGERFVPELPPTVADIDGLPADARYKALCRDPAARRIRGRLAKESLTLTMLQEETRLDVKAVTTLLEKASTARCGDNVFLPLRMHLFHRAQRGLWACVNAACSGLSARSPGDAWGFGAIFPQRHTHCVHCGYPVFEIVACGECGQDYLSASETFAGDTGKQKLEPYVEDVEVDEFQLEVDLDDDGEDGPSVSPVSRRLIFGDGLDADHTEQWRLDQDNTLNQDGDGIPVNLSPLTPNGISCPRCGAWNGPARLFRELRIGAPFALSTIVPTALEHTPPMVPGTGLPDRGRRLLGFSDSRQGSARLAVRLQQEAERNRVRSILYHALAAERSTDDTSELEGQIAALPASPELSSLRERLENELKQKRISSGLGTLTWRDAANRLTGDESLRRMHTYFRETTYIAGTLEEFANFCLYREFFRRPKRMNSVETLGLISLRYPALESSSPPPGWPLQAEEWPVFLKLIVDFFLRDASAVQMRDEYLRWMGIPIRRRYVQGPGYEGTVTRRQRHWPSMRPVGRMPRPAAPSSRSGQAGRFSVKH